MRVPQPPVAVALRFIGCVDRCDLDGLTSVMTDGHRLTVFDEHPVVGKAGNAQAWRGYFTSFPEYVIYPHKLASATAATVAILGHTAGSHLGLPDDDEARETLIWLAETTSGLVRSWTLMEDTPANRRRYALDR